MELNKCEIVCLIQTAVNFLIARYGQKPGLEQRRSLAATVGKLFPRLDVEEVSKKLDQRIKNVQRTVKVKKKHNRAKTDLNLGDSYDAPIEPAADYDELIKPHKVILAENCDGYVVEIDLEP